MLTQSMTPSKSVRNPLLRPVLFVAILAATVLWSQGADDAEAHAALIRSDPAVNAQLTDSPTAVTTFYAESIDHQLSSIKVLNGDGNRVDEGPITFGADSTDMSVAVKELDPGFYAVQWQTVSSADGHLLTGSFPFTVLNPDGSEPSGPRPSTEAVSSFELTSLKPEDAVTKWANLLGGILIVGGLTYAVAVAGPASRSLEGPSRDDSLSARRRHLAWAVWLGLAMLAISGVTELLLQANKLGSLSLLDEALKTGWGEHWLQRRRRTEFRQRRKRSSASSSAAVSPARTTHSSPCSAS